MPVDILGTSVPELRYRIDYAEGFAEESLPLMTGSTQDPHVARHEVMAAARKWEADVVLHTWNRIERKWDEICTAHPDGTVHDIEGRHLRFINNSCRPWELITE